MGMRSCSAAPFGCSLAQIQVGMVMVGLCEDVGVQDECARRVCKVSVQGEKCFIWGWGAVLQLPLAASLHKPKGEW